MIDPGSVRRRLRRLDEQVGRLRELAETPEEEFVADLRARAAAERLLQTSIQLVLDVGAHVLSDRGVVDWEEYREIPRRLADEGMIDRTLADRLEKAAGQRNVLVHMYLQVDPELVYRTLTRDLDVFGAFAGAMLPLLEEEEGA